MSSMFRFRRSRGPQDLALDMAGVRLGERVLQVGVGDPAVFAAMAGKVGLTGQACAVVDTADAAAILERAAAHAGVLVEVETASPGSWTYAQASFDVALVDANALLSGDEESRQARLRDTLRVVRGGGRAIAVFRARRSLASRLGFESEHGPSEVARALVAALGHAGFKPVRILAEREGLIFAEGFRAAPAG